MHSFKDKSGREWPITIDIFAARLIRQATGLAAESMVDPQSAEKWDRVAIFDALLAVCQPERAGVTVQQFAADLSDGDIAEAAAQALMEEVVDFLPLRQRSLLRSMMEQTRKMQQPITDELQRRVVRLADETLAQLGSGSSGTSPASPASAPPASTSPT